MRTAPIIVSTIEHGAQIGPVVLAWSALESGFSDLSDVDFAEALNRLVTAAGRADVALASDRCTPPADWVEMLSRAAAGDDIHAASGPVWHASEASVTATSPDSGLWPQVSALSPNCCYLRRPALDLVGAFTPGATPAAVLTDWCSRAIGLGFVCVLTAAVSMADPGPEVGMVVIEPTAAELGPLRRVLGASDRSGRPPRVTIDARALGPRSGGTQSYTGALVQAVAEHTDFSVRAIVAHDAPAEVTETFRAAGTAVVSYEQAVAGVEATDLLHRPQQVFGEGDLNLAQLLSDRLVLTHLDLIAFHNPSYHASEEAWLTHRRMTRIGMSIADMVVFTSSHARDDALAEELVEPERAAIAGIGVTPPPASAPRTRPETVTAETEFLLVLGADYAHKNRLFALRLLAALRDRHGFTGRLILAGRHMELGGSAAAEQALLSADPDLAAAVTDLGPVQDAERNWLLEHATAALAPSLYEGYGLTPLEAAAAGTPCVYGAVTAHGDVLGHEAATIEPWDAEASAARVAPLLHPGPARDRHLELLGAALERSNWETVAGQLAEAYQRALSGPYRAAAQVGWQQLEREQLIADLDRHRRELEGLVGNALALSGSGGLLTAQQQLGLIRVAARPRLARTVLKPFDWLGGLGSQGG